MAALAPHADVVINNAGVMPPRSGLDTVSAEASESEGGQPSLLLLLHTVFLGQLACRGAASRMLEWLAKQTALPSLDFHSPQDMAFAFQTNCVGPLLVVQQLHK